MGLFDGQPDYSAFGINNPSILGLLAGLGQAAAPSRMPVPFGSVLGSAASGLLGGQRAGLEMQGQQQKLTQGNVGLGQLLDQMTMAAKYYGVKPPTMDDLKSGRFQGLLAGGAGNNPGASAFPTPTTQLQQSPLPQQSAPLQQAGGADTVLPSVPSGGSSSLGGKTTPLVGAGPVAARLAMMGYGPEDRAAVLGNAAWESSLRPDALGDGGASFGLWQWQKDRRDGLVQYAQQTNRPPHDPNVQVEYMDKELRDRAPEFFDPSKSLAEKTKIFQDKFELPAKDTSEGRTRLAQNFLGQMTDAGSGAPPQAPGPTAVDPMAIRSALAAQQYMFGGKTPPGLDAYMASQMLPQGSEAANIARSEALAAGKIPMTIGGDRPGVPGRTFTGFDAQGRPQYAISFHNPATEKGQLIGPNGEIINAPGAMPALSQRVGTEESAKLPSQMYQKGMAVHPGGALGVVPGYTGATEDISRAHAAGPAGFEPQPFYGPTGQQYTGTRLQLGTGETPGAATGAPPQQLQPGQAPPAVTPPAAPAAPGAPANLRPEAAAPTFPVATPQGQKDVSQVGIDDLFPGGQGIPQAPPPPPGLGYGPPSEGQKEIQKQDAERLNGYNKESSENQKIYQDIAHLQDVLKRGLTTGKLTPLWTDLTNIAHQVGAEWAIPKNYRPEDAATFTKASTDLVFAAVKKLAGQVRVAEIQGYQQANPNISIPLETNYSILNDVLAAGKWQDSRAKLANEFVTKHPGAPLNVFDTRFNQVAPLSAVTDRYKDQMIALGSKMPGEGGEGNKAAIPQIQSKTIGGTTYHLIDGQWRPVIK